MSGGAIPVMQLIGLLLGIGVFIGLAVWLLRPGAARAARRHAQIPFREDPPDGRTTGRAVGDRRDEDPPP